MPMSAEHLKAAILSGLQSSGFDTGNEFSKADAMADAIAQAVVAEVQLATVAVIGVTPGGGTTTGTIS